LRILLPLLLAFLLASCGVRVEVAEIPQPTPTDRPWWRLYYSGNGAVRLLANPVVTFGSDTQPLAEVFMVDEVKPITLVQYRQFWVPVEYTVAWYAAEASEATVRLNLSYRSSGETNWQPYDSVEHVLNATRIPDQRMSDLGLSFYVETPGYIDVRAEVILNAKQSNGETIRQIDAREFQVHTMSDPGDIELDWDRLVPQLEGFADTVPLLDWRAWRGGPCGLAERAENTDYADSFSTSCNALNNGDIWGAMEPFGQLGDMSDAWFAADALGIAGVMLMQVGDYNNADSAFRVACELSKRVDDLPSMLIHMNNRMAAIAAQGDIEAAFQTLEEINEIRNQFWDEAGIAILDANTAYLSGDTSRLEDARIWFSEQGLPQAELLDVWLFRAQNGM
jgi:tetratricopeptide (TPR) repeat protein